MRQPTNDTTPEREPDEHRKSDEGAERAEEHHVQPRPGWHPREGSYSLRVIPEHWPRRASRHLVARLAKKTSSRPGLSGASLSGTSAGRSSDRARRCCRDSEQIERVRVALLRSRFDHEELRDPTGPSAACQAETTATVGRIGKVTSEAASAVEVDHSTAKGAVVCPVPMVGADHSSDPARSISPAEMIVCRRCGADSSQRSTNARSSPTHLGSADGGCSRTISSGPVMSSAGNSGEAYSSRRTAHSGSGATISTRWRPSELQAVRRVGRSDRALGRRLRARLSDDGAGAADISAPHRSAEIRRPRCMGSATYNSNPHRLGEDIRRIARLEIRQTLPRHRCLRRRQDAITRAA